VAGCKRTDRYRRCADRVAAGDVNGDGTDDLIATMGPGGAPIVLVFDGNTGGIISGFFALPPGFTSGLNVTAGDVSGDGRADIVAGAASGVPLVLVYDGATKIDNDLLHERAPCCDVRAVSRSYRPGAKQLYSPGETVRLVVRVRNSGMKDVKFVYAWESFYEQPPVVTNDAGKAVPLEGSGFSGLIQFKEVTLAPGKEIDLCELNLALRPASEQDKARPWTLYDTGKFQLQFERVGGNIGTGEIKYDPVLSKLVTGKLELEVKSDPPPAAEKK
jgi:hypothetical protein